MPSPAPSPVAIVGAGPTGIACAVELSRRGIASVCYDRGGILDTIYRMPEEMRWFSTRELLGIAGVPFSGPEPHPTRLETLAYYRSVAEAFEVRVVPQTEVEWIRAGEDGSVRVRTLAGDGRRGAGTDAESKTVGTAVESGTAETAVESSAPAGIVASGFFSNPKRLAVPGEDLPLVQRRYVSGYPFHGRNVVVVGGKNSAAEAALDLYRHGARVTLVVRREAISDRVKYWIKPDLENRIRAGSIRAFFLSRVSAIEPGSVSIETPAGPEKLSADAVFPLIGYEPDFAFFERCGIRVEGENRAPAHDPATLESNVRGLYLAGALLGGAEIGRIFIENSRHHAAMIAQAIEARSRKEGPEIAASPAAPATFFPEFRTSPGNDPDR